MFEQLKASLATVNAFLLIMEILEILIDALTFTDVLVKENFFDSGVMAGKGLVNAGFTIYYLIMQYWKPDEKEEWQLDWERPIEPIDPVTQIDPVVVA